MKDYHPIDNAIDPNAIKGRDADRIARVIIREHLEWERENPEPPAQLSTEELKEMSLKFAQETDDIKKEEKAFKAVVLGRKVVVEEKFCMEGRDSDV